MDIEKLLEKLSIKIPERSFIISITYDMTVSRTLQIIYRDENGCAYNIDIKI